MRAFFYLVLPALVLLAACMTPAVWEATEPGEFVLLKDEAIKESDLEARGITFFKDDETGELYIERSAVSKLGHYTVRTLATPVAVTLDAAGVAACIVVGGIAHGYQSEVEWERMGDPDYRDYPAHGITF